MTENLKEGVTPITIAVPNELSYMRADLQRFFDAMIYKLRRNRHKGRWENVDLALATKRLGDEIAELNLAISDGSTAEILMEAADVGNMALIVGAVALEAKGV